MLSVGDRFPEFQLKAVVASEPDAAFGEVRQPDALAHWRVVFFWPKDFTFVCPTEIAGFGALQPEFARRGADLLGVSTDSEYVHLAWRQQEPLLRDLPFPMVSDLRRDLSAALGVLDREEGVCRRATFIVDPDGVIRFVSVNDGKVGRNPEEVLRVLDALQTGALCGCNWRPGAPTLQAA
jgi:peroxiredoxin (alkyl hydroperoxide reductase subunit C)